MLSSRASDNRVNFVAESMMRSRRSDVRAQGEGLRGTLVRFNPYEAHAVVDISGEGRKAWRDELPKGPVVGNTVVITPS